MTILPKGKQWIAHDNTAARQRRLRQGAKRFERYQSPEALEAKARAIEVLTDHPQPFFALQVLFNRAQRLSDDTGVPWSQVLDHLVGQLELEQLQHAQAAADIVE